LRIKERGRAAREREGVRETKKEGEREREKGTTFSSLPAATAFSFQSVSIKYLRCVPQ
jgi:hypothetical protein